MIYGRNATACQILNPGISHWFSARFDAVARSYRYRVWRRRQRAALESGRSL